MELLLGVGVFCLFLIVLGLNRVDTQLILLRKLHEEIATAMGTGLRNIKEEIERQNGKRHGTSSPPNDRP